MSTVFDLFADRYDEWYEKNIELYKRELETVEKPRGLSLEIGVGTGRFASPLGIDIGIDISVKALNIARRRGVEVLRADAKSLPFKDSIFDYVYVIFTLCFLDNPIESLKETYRVLKDSGFLIVCIIPRNSGLGERYAKRRDSPFYSIARFYTESEVFEMLDSCGFKVVEVKKTMLLYSYNDFICIKAVKKGL